MNRLSFLSRANPEVGGMSRRLRAIVLGVALPGVAISLAGCAKTVAVDELEQNIASYRDHAVTVQGWVDDCDTSACLLCPTNDSKGDCMEIWTWDLREGNPERDSRYAHSELIIEARVARPAPGADGAADCKGPSVPCPEGLVGAHVQRVLQGAAKP
jgi:hypothetical protein